MTEEEDSIQFQSLVINNNRGIIQKSQCFQFPLFYQQSDSCSIFQHENYQKIVTHFQEKQQSPKTYGDQKQFLNVIYQSPFDNNQRKYQSKKLNSENGQQSQQSSQYILDFEPKRKARKKKKHFINRTKNSYQQLCRALLRYLKKKGLKLKGQEFLVGKNKYLLEQFIRQNLKQKDLIQIILNRSLKRELQFGQGSSFQKIFNIQILRKLTIQIIKKYQKQNTMFHFSLLIQRYE